MKVKSLQEILKHLAARTKAPKRIRIMPDRYDPEPVLVFVDEVTDQRPSGSHSRAQKVVAALSISIVCASLRFLKRSSRSSRAVSVGPPAASPASTSAWRSHLRSVSALIPPAGRDRAHRRPRRVVDHGRAHRPAEPPWS